MLHQYIREERRDRMALLCIDRPATGPSHAVRAVKKVIDKGAQMPMHEALPLEQNVPAALFGGIDAKKRNPCLHRQAASAVGGKVNARYY